VNDAPSDDRSNPTPSAEGESTAGGSDGAGPESGAGTRSSRHDRITAHGTPGPLNSLQYWTEARNPVRIVLNFLAVQVIKYSPILRVKAWLLRRLGAEVGANVSLALSATPDVFWPELITIEDDAIVGYDATILCHEFLHDEYRTGAVLVGERAMIGAGAVVLPGVEIGAGASVAANSLVAEDVPEGATVAGVPATPVGDGE